MGAARYAPYLLLNALAGVLIDRWDRRPVMIVADLGRCAVLATVPIAYALGGLTVAHLALVAFLEGVGHVFSAVSHLSNSAFRTLSFGAEPLGLALGGTLIAAAGSRAVFWGAAAGLALVLLGGAWAWRNAPTARGPAAGQGPR
ncbi:hypothetical protein V1460_12225 [Streptomyces sp. SCSIO 30461]|uniref:hypothetical protein n=1 Tax=Streptomyces sp. SCSIO 30461 TaxID=3118085 RepID=UPI0030D174C9